MCTSLAALSNKVVSLSEFRDVSADLAIADVEIDGRSVGGSDSQSVIRLGEELTITREYDFHVNETYKIVSLRLRLPETLAATIGLIDEDVAKKLPEGVSFTPLLDNYDPKHPRVEVRLDVDRRTFTLKTLIFDADNQPQNATSPWNATDLGNLLGNRASIDVKMSLEVYWNKEKRSAKIIPKATALLVRPFKETYQESDMVGFSEFKIGELRAVGQQGNMIASVVPQDTVLSSGSLRKLSVDQIYPGLLVLAGELETTDQRQAMETIDTFLKNAQEEVFTNLQYYPLKNQPEFRLDKTRTTITDQDGKSVSDPTLILGKVVNVQFAPEVSINKDKGRYQAILRARAINVVGVDTKDAKMRASEYTGPFTTGKAKQFGFAGNSYGAVADGSVFTDVFYCPEIRQVASLVLLKARVAAPCSDFFESVDEAVGALAGEGARHFKALRDGTDVEFRIDGKTQKPASFAETNRVEIEFTVEYSISADRSRLQTILRAKRISLLEPGEPPKRKPVQSLSMDELDLVALTPPKAVSDGGCYFGSYTVDNKPLTLNIGKIYYGKPQQVGATLVTLRCTPADLQGVSEGLGRIEQVFPENEADLLEATGAGALKSYPVFDNDSLEVRLGNMTQYIDGGLEDSNCAELVVSVDYSLQPLKERFQTILKARSITILPREEDGPLQKTHTSSDRLGLPIASVNLREEAITFEVPPAETMTKQKYLLFRYEGKPRSFLLENILLQREENQGVGLPSPEFESAGSPKLTVIIKDNNLSFFQRLDELLESQLPSIKEGLGLPANSKLSYNAIVNDGNGVECIKLALDIGNGKNPTAFYMRDRDHSLSLETIEDLRPFIKLGITLADPVVTISKLWHDKIKREVAVKLKLNSVVLIPSGPVVRQDTEGFRVEV